MAVLRSSGRLNAVRAMAGIFLASVSRARICRISSNPSIPGIPMSEMSKSNLAKEGVVRASAPLEATVTLAPHCCKRRRSTPALSKSSSTISTSRSARFGCVQRTLLSTNDECWVACSMFAYSLAVGANGNGRQIRKVEPLAFTGARGGDGPFLEVPPNA